MKLYVTRHGPAEDDAPSGIDGDRALSEAGRKRVRAVAKALVDLDEAPLLLIASPLVRAVQTAEIIAIVTKIDDREGALTVRRELSPGGDGAKLVRELASSSLKRVMLVGHEPDLSELTASLCPSFNRPFDKSMVVGLQLQSSGPRGRLRFVLDPKTLQLDPDARGAPT